MQGKIIYIIVGLLILAAFPINKIYGQGIQPIENYSGKGGFYIDYAQFRTELEGFNRLEVYYKIFDKNLQFVRQGNKYRASYELNLTVYDRDGRQITAASRDRTITAPDYKGTISTDDFRVSSFNLILPQGKYEIELRLIDKNTGADIALVKKTRLEKFDKREPMLSGIEFVQAIDSGIIDSSFAKGELTVIPSVTRVYAGDSTAFLLYYYEIYLGSEDRKDVVIETQLLDEKMEIVFRDSLMTEFAEGDNVIRRVREIPLWGFKSGDYTLNIALRGWRQRIVAQSKGKFSIYWSPEASVLHDYEKAVKQLKYIANKDEIDKLESATTPETRMEYWNKFWIDRDPSPGTPENETRQDYYNRIEYANRYFGIMRKEGWRTDRGMILIQFGQPDHIEDFPFELDSKAYVIWYYYHLKIPRKFLFVDEWGDSDYQLQYPYDGKM